MEDLHAAVESLAQAWIAAKTPTVINSTLKDQEVEASKEGPPTMIVQDGRSDRQCQALSIAASPQPTRVSTSAVKSLPIRCLIEIVNADNSVAGSETENYAIVPSSSLFKDIVKTVLLKLGHSTQDVLNANGALQIKNWKALSFETITDSPQATVEEILGDLTTVAILKIRISSRPMSDDLKDKLLHLLLTQSQDLLHKAGCPISKEQLDKMLAGNGELTGEAKAAFYLWYQKQTSNSVRPNPEASTTNHFTSTFLKSPRLRISFDPEQEVPRLNHWFHENSHPSRHQMIKYLDELNALPCRQSLKPLDLTNIMYWFKNARAAARRSGRSMIGDELSEDDGRHSPLRQHSQIDRFDCNQEEDMDASPENLSCSDSDSDDVSLTDDDDDATNNNIGAQDLTVPKNGFKQEAGDISPLHSFKREVGDLPVRSSSSSSSPKSASIYGMTGGLPPYPFPYGTLPMAYLQSQMHPFYKDLSEKVQSAVAQAQATNLHHNMVAISKSKNGERQKRHRAFIDPVSEIPKLEQYFIKDTHPSHYVIEQICDELNRGEFRSRYPKLSPKNIQLWFKNHRAKVKRMRVGGGAHISDGFSP